MNSFLTVFRYTFRKNVEKKSFLVSTSVVCLLSVLLMVLPGIFAGKKDGGSTTQPEETISSNTLYICDITGDNTKVIKSFASRLTGYKASFIDAAKIEEIKLNIEESGNESLMLISQKDGTLSFEYFVKGMANGANPAYLSGLLEYSNRVLMLKDAGMSSELAEKMTAGVTYTLHEMSGDTVTKTIISVILLMLIFFAIYFYGYGVSMSVASEKTSRVMELLITSAKPSVIVLGKSAAMGLLGLLQFSLVIASGVVSYLLFFPKDLVLGGIVLNFSMLTPYFFCMLLVYFILGYSLFAMLQAVTGASVSKAEDLTSAMMPVSFICGISFYLGYASLAAPDSIYATVVSILPFSAPFAMPLRLINGWVPLWQQLLSILLLIISTAAISFVSIKIYSNAVLHYGSKLSLVKLFKSK